MLKGTLVLSGTKSANHYVYGLNVKAPIENLHSPAWVCDRIGGKDWFIPNTYQQYDYLADSLGYLKLDQYEVSNVNIYRSCDYNPRPSLGIWPIVAIPYDGSVYHAN